MLNDTDLPALFERFEKVTIASERLGTRFAGRPRTIIWCDPPNRRMRDGGWLPWVYIVSFTTLADFRSFKESELQTTDEFDTEQSHLGLQHEISYDTMLTDDMGDVEGSFRIPGRFRAIFAFGNDDVPEIRHRFGTSESGMTSVVFEVPRAVRINHYFITGALAKVFKATSWVLFSGPDSMVQRLSGP